MPAFVVGDGDDHPQSAAEPSSSGVKVLIRSSRLIADSTVARSAANGTVESSIMMLTGYVRCE